MATLKDKVVTSMVAAGSFGWTCYGLQKWTEERMARSYYEWDTPQDKIKTIGKSVLAGICYGGAFTASMAVLIVAVQMWKEK